MGLARFFLDLGEAAERDPGASRRLSRIHAGTRVRGNLAIKVKSELFVELAVDRSSAENRPKAKQPVGEHAASYWVSRICETAAVSFCHADASVSSCARPLRVNS